MMVRVLAVLFAVLSAAPLRAQESVTININVDYRLVALRLAEEFLEPRYGALLTRAEAQSAAWRAFCSAAPTEAGFAQVIDQFAYTAQAWASVELVRYGPVSEDFRYERIAYWPERKNDVARGVTRLLADNDVLTPEAMPAKSVAVQGLSALERLLYDEGARDALFSGEESKRRCAAGVAISGNLRNVVKQVLDGWPPLKDKLRADPALAREAVSRFATDLLTIYQAVGDQKLDVPMGKTIDEARPKAAQYWRSGLSNATLALNLKSAADLTAIILGPSEEGKSTVATIQTAQRLAEGLAQSLPDMVADPKQRFRLLLVRDAVRGARDLSGSYVPAALGITLGFNSLDGD